MKKEPKQKSVRPEARASQELCHMCGVAAKGAAVALCGALI